MRTAPSALWWRLPGPGRFVEQVVEGLAAGITVLVEVPRSGPPDVVGEIRQRTEDSGRWDVRTLEREFLATGSRESIAEALRRRFVPEWPAGEVSAVPNVLGHRELQRNLFLLELQSPDEAEPWLSFLAEYGNHVRHLSSETRPVFCMILRQPASAVSHLDGLMFRNLRWHGQVSRLDMQYLASHLSTEYEESPLLRLVQVSVVASLGGFDPVLAAVLSSLTLDRLLEPKEDLLDFARRESYDKLEASWEVGTLDTVDGREHVHSAILALRGDHRELCTRVWSGQVAALLPHLEACRLTLVELGRKFLPPMPFESLSGKVAVAEELEIGPLHYLLRQDRRANHLVDRARILRELRNELAHRRPVPWRLIREVASIS